MVNAQQFERIQQLVQPITAISSWLLPKVIKFTALGLLSLAWLSFYYVQFWPWHYLFIIPLVLLAFPIIILAIWSLLLWDLAELPQALADLKAGVSDVKERFTNNKTEAMTTVISLRKTRQLPKLLKELFALVQGVDALRTIVTHVIFLANPLSWVVCLLSSLVVIAYSGLAILTMIIFII